MPDILITRKTTIIEETTVWNAADVIEAQRKVMDNLDSVEWRRSDPKVTWRVEVLEDWPDFPKIESLLK